MSSKSSISPAECTVFINIWVDVNATTTDSTKGIYCVDNMGGNSGKPSKNEGTPNLVTSVAQGDKVCWTIKAIDPKTAGAVSIISMSQGESGFSSPPGAYTGDSTGATWTGQMITNSVGGSIPQTITCSVAYNGGETLTITPSLNVYK